MTFVNALFCIGCTTEFSHVEVWTMTGSLQHLYSFLLLPSFCRFAAVFGIIVLLMTQFQPNFSSQTDGLTFDFRTLCYTEELVVDSLTARCPGPVAAEQTKMISPPPACLTVGMRYVFGVLRTWCCVSWSNIREVFFHMQLCKPKLCCSIPNKPYLISLFIIVLSWTLTFNMLT